MPHSDLTFNPMRILDRMNQHLATRQDVLLLIVYVLLLIASAWILLEPSPDYSSRPTIPIP